jgi:hypothetical protein
MRSDWAIRNAIEELRKERVSGAGNTNHKSQVDGAVEALFWALDEENRLDLVIESKYFSRFANS